MLVISSNKESLRHFTSSHEIARLLPGDTQEALKRSPAEQEVIESSPDGDSPHGAIKLSSLPQNFSHQFLQLRMAQNMLLLSKRERTHLLVPNRNLQLLGS